MPAAGFADAARGAFGSDVAFEPRLDAGSQRGAEQGKRQERKAEK